MVGNSVRDEVAAIGGCLSIVICEGKDRVEEPWVDLVVERVSFEEIVGAANKNWHFRGIFHTLCEDEDYTEGE